VQDVDFQRTGRWRVLLIEDNAEVAAACRALLEYLGHSAEVAATGLAGLEAAAALRPDVVLCDIGLPDIDGFEVARRLRARAPAPDLVLLAVSGHGEVADMARSASAGFDGHLVKPVSSAALSRALAAFEHRLTPNLQPEDRSGVQTER
jgi:two-component system CheB/CheR fusion protein